MPRRRIAMLTAVRDLNGALIYYSTPATRRGRSRVDFIGVEAVPQFEGETAWFEMEQVIAKPWSYWRPVRRVEPPGHAVL